jgi:hypothetical protein
VELAHILKWMVDKGLVLTVVLDSCHSGGAARGRVTLWICTASRIRVARQP